MNAATIAPAAVAVPRRIVVVGAAVLLVLAAVIASGVSWRFPLQAAWFDVYQSISPRAIISTPALVVEIDEPTLAAFGQWPWPRTQLAELVDAIAVQRPAAIGVDILMPEADGLSLERLLARAQELSRARGTARITTVERQYAGAIAFQRAKRAGDRRHPRIEAACAAHRAVQRARQVRDGHVGACVSRDRPHQRRADQPRRDRPRRRGSRADLGRAGRRRDPDNSAGSGRTRHIGPGVLDRDRELRNEDPESLVAFDRERSAQAISISDFTVLTEADGSVHSTMRSPLRIVSAQDVITGRVAPDRFESKLVLIGVTGQGLLEYQNTPLGVRMPGVEIHAQLLENLFDNTLLRRPAWAPALEGAVFLLLGALLIYATPRWKPRNAALSCWCRSRSC